MTCDGIGCDRPLTEAAQTTSCSHCRRVYAKHRTCMCEFGVDWTFETYGGFSGHFCSSQCIEQWTQEKANEWHGLQVKLEGMRRLHELWQDHKAYRELMLDEDGQ